MSNSNPSIGLFKILMMARRGRSNPSVSSKMELSTKVNGSWTRIKKMAAEFKFGQTDPDTTASGETVWPMAMADLSTLKEMSTRENGLRIRLMDMACTLTSTEVDMRASGSKISSMDSESSNGLMVPNTRVNMSKV